MQYLVTSQACEPCKELEAELAQTGLPEGVEIIDISDGVTDEQMDVLKKHFGDVTRIPVPSLLMGGDRVTGAENILEKIRGKEDGK